MLERERDVHQGCPYRNSCKKDEEHCCYLQRDNTCYLDSDDIGEYV